MVYFGLKMASCHNSESTLQIFFETLHNERGLELHENQLNGFSKKKHYFGQMGHFGPGNVCLDQNSGSTRRIVFVIQNNKGGQKLNEN